MSAWRGIIFFKDEDGYKIILRALVHYKKRLRTIRSSPELSGAAMFSQIIEQEAVKTHGKIEALIAKIPQYLTDSQCTDLADEIPIFEKALKSYRSDLLKAQSSEHEYYEKLIESHIIHNTEISTIDDALNKLQ